MPFKSVTLKPKDLARLDDGQGWWKSGDDVMLGGYLSDNNDDDNPMFQLSVNGYNHDNWTRWSDMPSWLKQKFTAGRKQLDVRPHSITLTDAEWQRLRELGGGKNASAGLRKLLAAQ